jgi:hypothetical protein
LRAALSDDSRRNRELDVNLAEQERLRVRIESLMIRATQYFEQGELDKAHRDAELAQHLADVCSLEFAPDEDRPVDLLAEIVARLEFAAAAQANEEPEPEAAPEPEVADDDVAVVHDDSTDFDPYSDRGLYSQPTRPASFTSSLVELEAPSFEDAEDEPAVSPTAYAAGAGISRSTVALSSDHPLGDLTSQLADHAVQTATLPPIETPPSMPELEAPSPPLLGPSFDDMELPPAHDFATAPVPRVRKVIPPKRGTVTLEDIEAEQCASNEDEKEIHTARAIPQWMVLACLSALAAAVSFWLIRRRALASF